jgi:hypothetical protein
LHWLEDDMTAIGIDTHKATLAACAVDELGRVISEATFANDPTGHGAFITWARKARRRSGRLWPDPPRRPGSRSAKCPHT